jgi:hypothetical protein
MLGWRGAVFCAINGAARRKQEQSARVHCMAAELRVLEERMRMVWPFSFVG